ALARRGASFFADLRAELGGFGGDLLEALWELVWAGVATNDTLVPLRAFLRAGEIARPDPRRPGQFAARRALAPPGSEGRWSLLPAPAQPVGPTARALALAEQLLERHGVLTREAVAAEGSPGGFAALAPVLRGLEDAGRVRRGYFVEGLGAMQFALPGADDRLREARDQAADEVVVLAATDPANVYGGAVPWPAEAEGRAQRAAGASVVLAGGRLVGYLGRGEHELLVLGPARDPAAPAARTLAAALADLVDAGGRRALLLERIDGAPAAAAPAAAPLRARGFQEVSQGLLYRAGR
ncbi:MAG TPA: DEAD/DEAH box helicase, partial [Polyangia bacterium]